MSLKFLHRIGCQRVDRKRGPARAVLTGLHPPQEPYANPKVDNYVHRNSICHVEPSDAVPSRTPRTPPVRLAFRRAAYSSVSMCKNHVTKGWHESRAKRAECLPVQDVRYQMCHCRTIKIKVAEQLLHTTVCLTIFEKCPNVAHEPQYCNLRKTVTSTLSARRKR